MQGVSNDFPTGIAVVFGGDFLASENVIEPAGDEQPGERPREGETILAFIFMQAGMAEPGRRMPTDRLAAELAIGDVERAIDQHGETQPGAGAKLQHPHASLDAVGEGHQAHAGELRQQAGALVDVALRQPLAVQFNHRENAAPSDAASHRGGNHAGTRRSRRDFLPVRRA